VKLCASRLDTDTDMVGVRTQNTEFRSVMRKMRDVRILIRFAIRKSQSGHGYEHVKKRMFVFVSILRYKDVKVMDEIKWIDAVYIPVSICTR
jgi:hypothetical protein